MEDLPKTKELIEKVSEVGIGILDLTLTEGVWIFLLFVCIWACSSALILRVFEIIKTNRNK